jgi:microcystin degradation protein MlrC
LQGANIDGLLLALHGAMVVEGYPQADAETVRRIRAAVGPDFPVVVTHDYHGNVPASLVADADALVIYKTTPHIDQRERGLQAASILTRTLRGEVKPVSAIVKPEVLFNIVYHNTSRPPMGDLMQVAIDLENHPDILAVSIAAGYQYADVPAMGPSIVVVTNNRPDLAEGEAARLGELMWDVREQLIPHVPDAATAVRRAIDTETGPISLFDLGDNIGGGSAGDATTLLHELLAQQATGWVIILYDPEAVSTCQAAGIGGNVSLEVGGKTDDVHGSPVAITGHVQTLHDGKFIETERRHGGRRDYDQGLTAVVEVGQAGQPGSGLVVLNSERTVPFSLHQLTSLGIKPQEQHILVVKGAVAPRAAYEPISAEIIVVDTPGATAISIPPEQYKLARKSLYEWQETTNDE